MTQFDQSSIDITDIVNSTSVELDPISLSSSPFPEEHKVGTSEITNNIPWFLQPGEVIDLDAEFLSPLAIEVLKAIEAGTVDQVVPCTILNLYDNSENDFVSGSKEN